jgi:isoaspartyl peptidase/L-asparaginase-like protein (Ntn-hydrolase superfamily)
VGGHPNSVGEVELDAAMMAGPGHRFGAVAALQHIRTPVSVARRLLEEHGSLLLAGQGALDYALDQGFEYVEDLSTMASARPAVDPPRSHDTVGVIVLDQNRDLWVGMSTSGTQGKLAGRVGDSPLVAAGSYVDNEVGAATGTGLGEQVMRFAGSYQIVENMRKGMSPPEAINEVLNRMAAKGHNQWVAFTAVNKEGEFGAVGMGKFSYYAYIGGNRGLESDQIGPVTTAVDEAAGPGAVPLDFELRQNYPNPFNSSTAISYSLPADGPVSLRVLDSRGALVRALVEQSLPSGHHTSWWDGRDRAGREVASGTYLCHLATGGRSAVRKMAVLR